MAYPWFKVYSAGVLRGSMVQDMDFAQQGIWWRLLAFVSELRERDGICRFAEGKPMPREFISNQTGVPVALLNEVIEIACRDENRLDDRHRIDIWDDGTVQITNWDRFQGDVAKQVGKATKYEDADGGLGTVRGKPNDRESKELRGKSLARKLGYAYPEDANVGIQAKTTEIEVERDIRKRIQEGQADTTTGEIKEGGE